MLSLGIALSPIPVIAVVALLLSRRPRTTGLGFTGGWLFGIVAATSLSALFALFTQRLGLGWLQHAVAVTGAIIGVVFIALGVAVWWRRHSSAAEPAWLAALDRMSVQGAVTTGFALSTANPKNLLASVSAGLLLGWSGLPTVAIVTSAAAFSLVAASTVLLPTLAYLAFGRAAGGRLATVRSWLVRNHAPVVAIVLIAIGLLFVVRGLGGL